MVSGIEETKLSDKQKALFNNSRASFLFQEDWICCLTSAVSNYQYLNIFNQKNIHKASSGNLEKTKWKDNPNEGKVEENK